MSRMEEYFAAKEAEDAARIILRKADNWFESLHVNGYLDKVREAWSAYHGAYYSDFGSGHRITFGGEQGELANLPVNHYRNICRHTLTMVTANRPSMESRATNTDYKSLVQTKLANGLLDYYMREKRLEDYLYRAIEYAIVLGSGYLKMDWNATSGEIYDYNDETKTPIYEGDVKFSNLSPFDVVFDSTKEDSSQHEWVVCRSFKNRFDLAAKYPEQKDDILQMETKDKKNRYDFTGVFYDESDDIAVYEFYHKRTEALPEGRYIMFVDTNVVLVDTVMPYRDLPVYRVAPADILGTPYGYSDTFDVLPIQDAINSMYSAILTNNNAFAVQNILSPRGCDVTAEQVGGGLNFIEYNPINGQKPEALNLLATSPETYKFLEILERTAETISGVNSVSRGNPESSLKSGNALALVQSMALQFVSGLQQSYVKMIEDVGTGLINMLKDFAAVPRVAMIVGQSNRSYMKEFSGDDLSNVNRVIVDVGNPLAKTTAGRVQMAEQLLQMGLIRTPEQYISVINTGKLETMTDGIDKQLLLTRAENEKMLAGETVVAVATEAHAMHIKEHGDMLADPDLKNDPQLVQRVLDHIQEHLEILRNTDPELLNIRGEQPLAPVGGHPANQDPNMPPMNAMGEMEGVMQLDPTMAQAAQNPEVMQGTVMPQPAKPPAPFNNLPTDPRNIIT
jgi:hypothetical protein